MARPIVPLSNREIGFLPGDAVTIKFCLTWDTFTKSQFKTNEKKRQVLQDLEDSGMLTITALAFIRGRSLKNAFFYN